ncbi:hypothetical protein B0H17DRAFT_1211234 [Mycena rosella]|uniref:Uncharacterized protein n=1 Tax=Mycena rosella TaxID=1033263 RepID=A0AAD7G6I0_MYCRO|nr:hypothetical protein B0H17DRAFT_1211234 [Mycena rosella]
MSMATLLQDLFHIAILDDFPCYDDQLPNLIALEVGTAQALPINRELQRIQLGLTRRSDNLEQLSALSRYSPTLTTLNIVQVGFGYNSTTLDIFERVAQEPEVSPDSLLIDDSPISALTKFTKLETFILYSKTIIGFHDSTLNHNYALETRPGLNTFGMAIMTACPTLRRAIVGAWVYDPDPDSPWPFKTSELVCTLRRTSGGGSIQSEFGTEFDFAGTSMFWEPYP